MFNINNNDDIKKNNCKQFTPVTSVVNIQNFFLEKVR